MNDSILLYSALSYATFRTAFYIVGSIYKKSLKNQKPKNPLGDNLPDLPHPHGGTGNPSGGGGNLPGGSNPAPSCTDLCNQLTIAKNNTLHFQRIKDDVKDSEDSILAWGCAAISISVGILGAAITAAVATQAGLTIATLIAALSLGLGTPVGWIVLIILAAIIVTLIIVIVGAIISLAIAQDDLKKAIAAEEDIRNQIIAQCSNVAGGLNCLN